VVIYQENVSLDHYFATYPHAANSTGEPRLLLAVGRTDLPGANYQRPPAPAGVARGRRDHLEAIPGVDGASLTVTSLPMRGESDLPFWLAGQTKPSSEAEMKPAVFYFVQPDYLHVMRTPRERAVFLRLRMMNTRRLWSS
jgi:hypothetical protein